MAFVTTGSRLPASSAATRIHGEKLAALERLEREIEAAANAAHGRAESWEYDCLQEGNDHPQELSPQRRKLVADAAGRQACCPIPKAPIPRKDGPHDRPAWPRAMTSYAGRSMPATCCCRSIPRHRSGRVRRSCTTASDRASMRPTPMCGCDSGSRRPMRTDNNAQATSRNWQ